MFNLQLLSHSTMSRYNDTVMSKELIIPEPPVFNAVTGTSQYGLKFSTGYFLYSYQIIQHKLTERHPEYFLKRWSILITY